MFDTIDILSNNSLKLLKSLDMNKLIIFSYTVVIVCITIFFKTIYDNKNKPLDQIVNDLSLVCIIGFVFVIICAFGLSRKYKTYGGTL